MMIRLIHSLIALQALGLAPVRAGCQDGFSWVLCGFSAGFFNWDNVDTHRCKPA